MVGIQIGKEAKRVEREAVRGREREKQEGREAVRVRESESDSTVTDIICLSWTGMSDRHDCV